MGRRIDCVFSEQDWKKYKEHCYYFSTTSRNWFDAEVRLCGRIACIRLQLSSENQTTKDKISI